jgi:protein SCO1/2
MTREPAVQCSKRFALAACARATITGSALAVIAFAASTTQAAATPEPARFGLAPVAAPDVAFEPRVGAPLPLQQPFTAADGRHLPLGAYFDGVHPVVLVPGYHRCPELCGLTMQGILEGLAASGLDADAYRVVRVSIDPDETPADARARIAIDAGYASTLVAARGRAGHGWPPAIAGLVGAPPAVAALTAALGYEARRVAGTTDSDTTDSDTKNGATKDGASTHADPTPVDAAAPAASARARATWAHAAGFVVATPDGRIAQAFDGVRFDAPALRAALVEAADGRLGTLGERFLLVCSRLDPLHGSHGGAVLALLRASALGGVSLLGFWIWRHRRPPPRTSP